MRIDFSISVSAAVAILAAVSQVNSHAVFLSAWAGILSDDSPMPTPVADDEKTFEPEGEVTEAPAPTDPADDDANADAADTDDAAKEPAAEEPET
ncbi:hypothetical protein ABW20_dc0100409 [Dactylellina cionopaga]|nr:hypothetical protein ABW20_dc0100409 [Dactylellina cionopaga]